MRLTTIPGVGAMRLESLGAIFRVAASNPLNRFVTVDADHSAAPDIGVNEMIRWLDALSVEAAD